MKKAGGDHWICLNSIVDAEKEAFNTWMGATLPGGNVVTSELIEMFFSGEKNIAVGTPPKVKWVKEKIGSCPNVYQRMVVPLGPKFVMYKGQTYANTWYDDMISGNADHLKLGKAVLLMCYASLCNGVVDKDNIGKEADRVYQMVVNDDYDNLEFRFFMYWISAIIQNPGINLQTNLWLIGEVQGLGKGTIVDIMRLILGSEFVGELNQTEIEAGWNDHLVGLQLVEINEFDTSNPKGWKGNAWGKWIKGHTIEPSIKIRERNKTSYNVLHIGNFIGTSNTVEQTFIDANDRRNQFIQTTPDTYWVQYATAIQIKYFKKCPLDVASGFAYILEQVKVDMDFIAKSHKNQFRNSIAANNQTMVEEWFDSDPSITKNKWMFSRDLYEEFKNWFRVSHPSDLIPSEIRFGKDMYRAAHIGVVSRNVKAGKQYMFDVTPNIVESKLEDSVTDLNKITLDTDQIVVYDLDVKEGKVDLTALTPIQKLRAALIKQEAAEGGGGAFDAD